jgi:hypothetical protein
MMPIARRVGHRIGAQLPRSRHLDIDELACGELDRLGLHEPKIQAANIGCQRLLTLNFGHEGACLVAGREFVLCQLHYACIERTIGQGHRCTEQRTPLCALAGRECERRAALLELPIQQLNLARAAAAVLAAIAQISPLLEDRR